MAFIKFKNEEEDTQRGALYAIVLITIALASLSVGGVFATSTWSWGSAPLIFFFAACVLGAEALAALALVRVMLAASRLRKIVGSLIFIGLAWVCVQNAKNGVHFIQPDRFAESSAELAAKAQLAAEEAAQLGEAAQSVANATPQELERVRTQIADLEAFLLKMSAMSPEGIKEAQSEMISRCGYTGNVDGIRAERTEAAMRVCGERINRQLDVLRQRETNLATGVSSPVQAATTDRRTQQIEIEAKANEAFWAGIWLEVMLWVLEGARSFGLWVFVTSVTATGTTRMRDLRSQIAEAELEAELAKVRAKIEEAGKPQPVGPVVMGADEFVEKVDEALNEDKGTDAPDSPPRVSSPPPDEVRSETENNSPPPDLTAAQRRARKGGQAAGHSRRADRNQRKIPVTDDRQEDAMFFDEQEMNQ